MVSSNLNQVTAVILAGGFGTRIRHLLPNLPKPMAHVAGKPFLEWVVRYLAMQGIHNVIISTGYLAGVIADYFQNDPVKGITTCCVAETVPLGTAGGFLNAIQANGQAPAAWLVLNGDSLVFAELASMIRCLSESEVQGVILGSAVPDTARYGSLVRNGDGALIGFAEKRPGAGVISAGVYLLRHAVIERFPTGAPLSFEHDVFPLLLRQGVRLSVVEIDAPFLDIGTEETFSKAEGFIRQNLSRFYV